MVTPKPCFLHTISCMLISGFFENPGHSCWGKYVQYYKSCRYDVVLYGKWVSFCPAITCLTGKVYDNIIFDSQSVRREHGMKRMGNHGGMGSNQQLPVSVGSNQILGSGQNLMSDSSYQSGESRSILCINNIYCTVLYVLYCIHYVYMYVINLTI